jgi:hypothetical protein
MSGGPWRWWLILAVAIAAAVIGAAGSWMVLATRVLRHVPAVITSAGPPEAATTWEAMPTDLADFHRALVGDPAFQARTREPLGDPAAIAACQALPIEARFAWSSDVQIRQREAKLYGRSLSAKLDRFIDSFERNPQQEEYDWAVYLSIVAAVNQLNVGYHRDHAPLLRFAIHTGDAMDAGFIQELYQFIAITNLLNMPWFNVVGNHDSAVFGNYLDDMSWTARAASDFYPAASLSTFLAMHDSAPPRLLRFHGATPLPPGTSSDETITGEIELPEIDASGMHASVKVTPPSLCHGFDLAGTTRRGRCAEQPGYYWFPLLDTSIVIVVLQSSRAHEWGEWSGWDSDPTQLAWLEREIVERKELTGKTLLVFMHHRVDEANPALRRLLDRAAARNAIAVFTGHTHDDDLTAYAHFHDINLASIISFPQMARIIELHRQPGERRGCLVSRPLWTTAWDEAMRLATPSVAALDRELAVCEDERTQLRDTPDKQSFDRCDRDGDTSERCAAIRTRIARMVGRAATCGHLGAIADHVHRRHKMPALEEPVTSFVIQLDIPQEVR